MATFRVVAGPQPVTITFVNHSNTEINYDARTISADPNNYGNIAPGATAQSNTWQLGPRELEYGDVAVVGIGQFGQPQLVPAPRVRFWSGKEVGYSDEYINLLGENGWTVTRNTSEISEVTGYGFRVTVDGGGRDTPTPAKCFFQVYNA